MITPVLSSFLIAMVFFSASCSGQAAVVVKPDLVLIGSTPAGPEVRSALKIDQTAAIDFIRWEIAMNSADRTYALSINYGEGQPNTNDFKGGGEWRKINGQYKIVPGSEHQILSFNTGGDQFSLVRISENVFHFIEAPGRLLRGSGGWGYSLSRRSPVAEKPRELVSFSKHLLEERSSMVFTGRTPCVDFRRADLTPGPHCYKLKWKLTLERNPSIGTIGKYRLESTVSRQIPVVGTWSLVNGTHESPNALLLVLDVDDPARRLTFFVADEKIIYLMTDGSKPGIGNDDFGFSLTRMD